MPLEEGVIQGLSGRHGSQCLGAVEADEAESSRQIQMAHQETGAGHQLRVEMPSLAEGVE